MVKLQNSENKKKNKESCFAGRCYYNCDYWNITGPQAYKE